MSVIHKILKVLGHFRLGESLNIYAGTALPRDKWSVSMLQ